MQAFVQESYVEQTKEALPSLIRNETDTAERQAWWTDDDVFGYLRFQVQVATFRGATPTTIKVNQDYTGDGQTDAVITVTEQSSYTSTVIDTGDINWQVDPKMPRLDITKYVKVLGDYYERNFTSWKTITRFSINADYEAIEY